MTASKDSKSTSGQPEIPSQELQVLNIRGEMYRTRLTRKYLSRKTWKKPDEKHLVSFIPGTICSIFIKPGDVVDTSSKLLILEAMKMQNVIYAPVEGKIKSVLVREGEKVKKGVVMIEFD